MKSRPNILFTATFIAPFIKSDIEFLQKNYSVSLIICHGIKAPLKYVRAILNKEITFTWFASTYSAFLIVLVKLLSKKSILIIGGVDVAKEKDLNYGIWTSWWKSIMVRYAIMNANNVLAVDNTIKINAINLCKYNGKNIQVIPTGYDPEFWKPGEKKQNIILTIARCESMTRIRIKGIDFLLDAARKTEEISFVIIGINNILLEQLNIPKNVTIFPFLPQNEILKYCQKAKIYFQPSYREGLPNSLCEAMLCECFPIGTHAGGIPNAIKDTGIIVEYGNVNEASSAIRSSIKRCDGKSARQRIIEYFSKTERENRLLSLISSISQ